MSPEEAASALGDLTEAGHFDEIIDLYRILKKSDKDGKGTS